MSSSCDTRPCNECKNPCEAYCQAKGISYKDTKIKELEAEVQRLKENNRLRRVNNE